MKKIMLLVLVGLLTNSFASTDQMKINLVKTIKQINVTLFLAKQAEKDANYNARTQFHYQRWQDQNGKLHNGLVNDLETVKRGIVNYLNPDQTIVISTDIQAMSGDYTGGSQ